MEGAEKHSIYDKLSDEADRIRKWKIETEFDQRIKDREIRSLKQSIEKYKKNLREINEEKNLLKIQYKNERSKSDDYAEKHKINRSLLKEINSWYEQVEEKIKKVAEEKEILVGCIEYQKKEVFSFAGKFEKMYVFQKEQKSSFDRQVVEARNENDKLQLEIQKLNQEIERQEHERLTKTNHLENELEKIKKDVSENEALKKKLNENENSLNVMKGNLEQLDEKVRNACEERERGVEREGVLKEELHRLEEQVGKMCEDKSEIETVMHEQLKNLQVGMEAMLQEERKLKECLELEKRHNDDLSKLKTELKEQMKLKDVELERHKNEWQSQCERLRMLADKNESLKRQMNEVEDARKSLSEEMEGLQAEIEKLKRQSDEDEKVYKTLIQKLQLQIDEKSRNFNAFFAEMTSKHEIEILEHKKLVDEMKEVVKDHQKEKNAMNMTIISFGEEIKKMEEERYVFDEEKKSLAIKLKEKESELQKYKEEEVFKMKEIDIEVQKLLFTSNKNFAELNKKQQEVAQLRKQLQEAARAACIESHQTQEGQAFTPKLQCKTSNVPKSLDSSLSQKRQASSKTNKTRIQKENTKNVKKEDIDWLLM